MVVALAGGLAGAMVSATKLARTPAAGFYGGVAMRDNGAEQGVALGDPGHWERFTPTLVEVPTEQTTVFGGYRWRNDLALEAALGTDGYRLPGGGGVGLMLPGGSDTLARTWNLDVYGSWAFWRRLSLYGRLGFSQSETSPVYSTAIIGGRDRRYREGLNYGVGLRYDVTRSLGLKLEYARVGATPADGGSLNLPEADQLQFGVQFRF